MADEQKMTLADGHQISLHVYDEQHNRTVQFCRERSALNPSEPTYAVSQFIREAIAEKLERDKP